MAYRRRGRRGYRPRKRMRTRTRSRRRYASRKRKATRAYVHREIAKVKPCRVRQDYVTSLIGPTGYYPDIWIGTLVSTELNNLAQGDGGNERIGNRVKIQDFIIDTGVTIIDGGNYDWSYCKIFTLVVEDKTPDEEIGQYMYRPDKQTVLSHPRLLNTEYDSTVAAQGSIQADAIMRSLQINQDRYKVYGAMVQKIARISNQPIFQSSSKKMVARVNKTVTYNGTNDTTQRQPAFRLLQWCVLGNHRISADGHPDFETSNVIRCRYRNMVG